MSTPKDIDATTITREQTTVNSTSERFATELDPGQTILAIVGANSLQFSLPIKLACEKSGFFCAACLGGFKESVDKVVRLPEESVEAFRIFVRFLNTGKVYVLGDRLQVPDMQTVVIKELSQYMDTDVI
ncbi:MAG: hypothetical protein M1829_004828 [Trizodia sp. TS-e1964]|nr:MAG: hypothetical protein M1829_004828 [Trizodia sp. TS-e1964]